MDPNGDSARELGRAKSFQLSNRTASDEISVKYKTATPSLLARFRLGTMKKRSIDAENSVDSKTVDDLICLDSFEEPCDSVVRVPVTHEALRLTILAQLRLVGSHVDVFADLARDSVNFQKYSHFERNFAFLAAALLNRYDLVDQLLTLNVDETFHETNFGFGALHCAAFSGATKFCEILLARGASLNPSYGVYSPLHCAALGNSPDTLQQLLAAGASMDKTQPAGETALASAVRSHSVACVQLLISMGADVNITDSSGATPLHLAADLGDLESARCLVECGRCVVDAATRTDLNTALHLAAQGGACDIVRLLLQHGASPNATNARQKTPLHFSSRVSYHFDILCRS